MISNRQRNRTKIRLRLVFRIGLLLVGTAGLCLYSQFKPSAALETVAGTSGGRRLLQKTESPTTSAAPTNAPTTTTTAPSTAPSTITSNPTATTSNPTTTITSNPTTTTSNPTTTTSNPTTTITSNPTTTITSNPTTTAPTGGPTDTELVSSSTGGVVDVDNGTVSPQKTKTLLEAMHDPNRDFLTIEQIQNGGVVLYVIGMLYMFVALAIVCDEYFVPSLEIIAEKGKISNEVAGATLMAAGGSAPELFTSFIGTFTNSAVGFGTIVGSAVFNVLFVIGMCAFFSREVLVLTWWPLARDATYYAISLGVLALFFSTGREINGQYENIIDLWEAIVLFVMYLGYVALMNVHNQLHAAILRCCCKKAAVERLSGVVADAEMEEKKEDVEDDKDQDEVGKPPKPLAHESSMYLKPTADFRRPSTFRAGFMQLMLDDKPLLETAGVHVCHRIQGTALDTFEELDTDKSGFIDADELKDLLTTMGVATVTPEMVEKVMDEIDEDGDKKINFDEFQAWYVRSEARIQAEVSQAFASLDFNKNGKIDTTEVARLLETVNHKQVTQAEVELAIKELDSNEDGQISEKEFQTWYLASSFFNEKKTAVEKEADEAEGLSLAWPADKSIRSKAIYILLLPITVPLFFCLPPHRAGFRTMGWGLVSFIGAIVFIGIYSYLMVWWTEIFGATLNIPSQVMGLTFLAAGTSVPDLLSSVIVARQGEGDMAVSSSLGSNIFDVLVGLPLPWLIYNFIAMGDPSWGPVIVYASCLDVSILVLMGMLVGVIGIIAAFKWRMTKALGLSMLGLYVIFVFQDLYRTLTSVPC